MQTDITVNRIWAALLNVALFGGALALYWFLAGPLLLEEVFGHWAHLVVGVPAAFFIHEWIHLVGFRILGGAPKRSVSLRFQWRTLTPGVHCSIPIGAKAYRWSCLAPMWLLGVIPLAVSLLIASPTLAVFAGVMLSGSAGDLLVALSLFRVGPTQLVKDHESRLGCTVVSNA